ncbi:MAG: PAS domain-containing protein [Balneola sp.]
MSFIERISPKQIYIIAVSTLIVLIASNQLLIQKILEEKKDDASIINLAGRQRMLSQKIAKNVFLSLEQETNIQSLNNDVENWSVAHGILQQGSDSLGISANENEYIQSQFFEIEVHFQAIANSLSEINTQEDIKAAIPIVREHEAQFLAKMDEIVSAFEMISNNAINNLVWIEIILGICSLLILSGEVYLVFKVFLNQIKAKNEELEVNAKRLEEAQEIAKIGNWNWDMIKDEITWSYQNYKVFGQSEDFKPDFEKLNALIPEEDQEPFQKDVENAVANNEEHNFIHRIVLDGNKVRYIHEKGRVFYNEKGSPIRMAGTSQDVTESMLKELKLEAQATEVQRGLDLLSETQHAAKIGSWEVDLKTSTPYWSDEVYRIHEVEIGTEIDLGAAISYYREDFREVIEKAIEHAITEKASWDVECVLVTAKDNEIWVRATGHPVFENREAVGLRGLFMDIDESKRKSLELDETNEKLQLSVEAGQIAIWIWDLKTNELDWNEKAYEVFGIEKDVEPTFNLFSKMIHPEDLNGVIEATQKTIETGNRFDIEFRLIKPDGSEAVLSGRGDAIYNKDGVPIQLIGINMDITERMKLVESIRLQESQLRSFVEQAPAAVAMFDNEMRYITVSNKWYVHNKIDGENIIGLSHYDVLPQIKARKDWVKIHQRVLKGEELSSSKDRFVRKDGTKIWIGWTAIPWFNTDKEIGGMILYVSDISKEVEYTEQLEKEIEVRTQQIRKQAENLELANKELESFSYSISHDLRAPLRSINGFSDILLEDYSEQLDEEGKRLMGVVKESAVMMGQLIDDMLDFSRLGKKKIQKSEIDMKKLFESVFESESKTYPEKNIELHISDLPYALGDIALLKQVAVNLISNSLKYASKKEEIVVIIDFEKKDDNQTTYFIKDNGTGFKMEYHDKLFGVFQRLHSRNEFDGTGVGLAIAKRILNKHGGKIWAESKAGKGSTFFFSLPNN